MLRLSAGVAQLAGPCGPDPWYLELGPDDDAVEVVSRLSENLLGRPLLVHSTSWRRSRGSVILSFVVVIDEGQAQHLEGLPIARADLARSGATQAPMSIATAQVIEHGLRHLSWLVHDDPTVQAVLSPAWIEVLAGYAPEPFQQL